MAPKSKKTAKAAVKKTPSAKGLPKSELKFFKTLLVERKRSLTSECSNLENGVLHKNAQESSGDLSTMPSHLADLGSDNYEQDVTLGLLEGEQEEIRLIDEALERIADGTYGICDKCRKPIPKMRLKAIPFVRCCVPCQAKEEKS